MSIHHRLMVIRLGLSLGTMGISLEKLHLISTMEISLSLLCVVPPGFLT
jgi:hypothetical protein